MRRLTWTDFDIECTVISIILSEIVLSLTTFTFTFIPPFLCIHFIYFCSLLHFNYLFIIHAEQDGDLSSLTRDGIRAPCSGRKWSESVSCSVVWLFVTPWTVTRQASLSLEFSRQEFWRELPRPHLGYPPNPGIEPRFPTLQVDSLSTEPPGRPINTGVGSLSLLQEIFLTQESNQGLLHCRRILY